MDELTIMVQRTHILWQMINMSENDLSDDRKQLKIGHRLTEMRLMKRRHFHNQD